ncbi:hypothetical protein [Mycobacterium sp. RTGN5]|uniref:hypothetical protein n=1 Tax=Mycobacterium sp. RTGN5 TaxID=3016522 RepID=UPI0029C7CC68|nr:hypothetical protein [Mycobacterium sp. RTGN5]
MRRALGPFLTTGVALVAATVVVANPVAPPSRDMQISTTQLSTSPDLLSPSDKSLLSALSPALSAESIAPALAQILAALAADADRISREVTSEVSPDLLAAAAVPEQTGYRSEPLPGAFAASANATPDIPTSFATPVATDVQQVLNGLVADTSYLGGTVVEAAYAVVDVIIRAPQFVFTAVIDLLNGDIAGALDTVRSAIKAVLGPVVILLDGIRNVLFGREVVKAPSTAATTPTKLQENATDTEQATTDNTPASPNRDGKGNSNRKRSGAPSAGTTRRTTTTPTSTEDQPTPAADDTAQTPTAARTHGTGKAAAPTRSKTPSGRDTKSTAGSNSSSE